LVIKGGEQGGAVRIVIGDQRQHDGAAGNGDIKLEQVAVLIVEHKIGHTVAGRQGAGLIVHGYSAASA